MQTIGVIGAGAWGTALAQVFARGGNKIDLWARESDVADAINNQRINTSYLADVTLHDNITATTDLQAVANHPILLMVTPAQHVRSTLEQIKDQITGEHIIVLCAKGIELNTGMLLSQVCEQVAPGTKTAILTGPTFAREIASGLPCAVTIAVEDKNAGKALQDVLAAPGFRPYLSTDVIGAQLGGAIKNVIAIACGIVYGKGLGESARAALLTRGVAEIARLASAMGAKRETLLGMCGIGDLMLTAASMQSRNFSLGHALGEGQKLADIIASRNSVTEGIHTAQSALKVAKHFAVDMPITEAVNRCLSGDLTIDDAIEEMMNRPFRYELSNSTAKH